jgi:hypothetical protein
MSATSRADCPTASASRGRQVLQRADHLAQQVGERGETLRGKDTLHELADDWRLGGTLIDDIAEPGQRREAFNAMLSMPRGTDPLAVHHAARECVKIELADHKYVMVLHDHQANPHVRISVRAESKHGKRLNPRTADLADDGVGAMKKDVLVVKAASRLAGKRWLPAKLRPRSAPER